MNKDDKHLLIQLLCIILALVLMLLPFFLAKWNMLVHYVFSGLSFAVLLINYLVAKKNTFPFILLLAGSFLILACLRQAKHDKDENERRWEELYKTVKPT